MERQSLGQIRDTPNCLTAPRAAASFYTIIAQSDFMHGEDLLVRGAWQVTWVGNVGGAAIFLHAGVCSGCLCSHLQLPL